MIIPIKQNIGGSTVTSGLFVSLTFAYSKFRSYSAGMNTSIRRVLGTGKIIHGLFDTLAKLSEKSRLQL